MKRFRETLRRHRLLVLLVSPLLFVVFSLLCGLLFGRLFFDTDFLEILFISPLIALAYLFYILFAGLMMLIEAVCRRFDRRRGGATAVTPKEPVRRRLRFLLVVGIPGLLLGTAFGYGVLLGQPLIHM